MKIRTVKKVLKEIFIKGRNTPLASKVTLKHLDDFKNNRDHEKEQPRKTAHSVN